MSTDDTTDYTGPTWGQGELIAELKRRRLPAAGTNADRAQRLRDDDASRVDDDDPLGLGDEGTPATGEVASAPVAGPHDGPVFTRKTDSLQPGQESAPASAITAALTRPAAPARDAHQPTTKAFRVEYVRGGRNPEADDGVHFFFINETRAAAAAAGLRPRGGINIGRRIGYGVDATGARTVVYEVSVKQGDR